MLCWTRESVRCAEPDGRMFPGGRTQGRCGGKQPSQVRLIVVLVALTLICAVTWPGTPCLADNGQDSDGIMDLSLDDLMNVQVTSVSKKSEKLSDASAAIFVITSDDIRRSGALTLPDVLRMVPGMEVGRIDANRWAVSSRGFNGAFANKLLVLVDGRSVYTPTFSGVYWDIQDLALQDIDRIEVIRGPGATLWGVNAVNGVINVLTKSASHTQGAALMTAGGDGDVSQVVSFRYGDRVGDNLHWRAYGKTQGFGSSNHLFNGPSAPAFGTVRTELAGARDDWTLSRAGFRADGRLSEADDFTLQGDYYDGTIGTAYGLPELSAPYVGLTFDETDAHGGYMLARGVHRFRGPENELRVQLYYDHNYRRDALYGETDRAYDVDVQQSLSAAPWLDVLGGIEYRVVDLTLHSTDYIFSKTEISGSLQSLSSFLQGDVGIWNDRLNLTLGAKFEETEYSGMQTQPNARVTARVARNHTLWASVSRASRTPSSIEEYGSIWLYSVPPFSAFNETPMTLVAEARGDGSFGSESMTAWEAGYRAGLSGMLSLDLAVFHNEYRNLVVNALGTAEIDPGGFIVQPMVFSNGLSGTTEGIEVAADWLPWSRLRVKSAYSYLDMALDLDISPATVTDNVHPLAWGHVPKHQVSVRTQFDVHRNVDFDCWLRTVDELATLDIPAYTELDMRIEWRPIQKVSVAIVGRNLLHDKHDEFVSELTGLYTPVERAGYVSLSLGL